MRKRGKIQLVLSNKIRSTFTLIGTVKSHYRMKAHRILFKFLTATFKVKDLLNRGKKWSTSFMYI